MSSSYLKDARGRWLEHISGLVVTAPAKSSFGASAVPPLTGVERALIELHAGLSHLEGGDRDQASLEAFCSPDEADHIIGRWRSGRQSAHVMGELRDVWHALWYMGAWTDHLRSDLSDRISESFLSQQLRVPPPSAYKYSALWNSLDFADSPQIPFDDVWNCEGSHLELIRTAASVPTPIALALLPLEKRALAGARRHEYLEMAFARSASFIDAPLAAPHGWGGPDGADVPSWLTDYVIPSGGRTLQERAGVIPTWFFVAETPEELRAASGLRFEAPTVALAIDTERPGDLLISVEVDFGDGEPAGRIHLRYATRYFDASAALDMLAWVETARLEVYEIADAQLKFAFALAVDLHGAREKLVNADLRSFPDPDWFENVELTTGDVLDRMRNAERVQFEAVRRGEAARREGESAVSDAYLEYLEKLDLATRSEAAHISADGAGLERARRRFLAQLSLADDPLPDISLARLGHDRGFAQLQLLRSEPSVLYCAIAYEGADGSVGASLVQLAESDFETGELRPNDEGFVELDNLGLKNVVISPAGPLYSIPCHEDLLAEGFAEVSYAHRSTIIRSDSPTCSLDQSILLSGWAGDAKASPHLRYLDTEVSALETIYGQPRQPLTKLAVLPEVVHLAGHGEAGQSHTAHWLRASESLDHLITPARVLLEADASATELVYLSACSTGQGVFGGTTVMEALPLDVAFLERGATCVVSTSAPVNDAVASVFAIVFHATWRTGASVWEAYVEARSLASQGLGSSEGLEALGVAWPTWRVDLDRASRAHPDDWMRFKLSGRHW